MIDFTSPLEGLQRSEEPLNRTAAKIASWGSSSGSSGNGDAVDLSAEMIALIAARNNFTANTKAVMTGDEMTRSLLDLLS